MTHNLTPYRTGCVVQAGRITDVYPEGMRNTKLEVLNLHSKLVIVDVGADWFYFNRPEAGGYFVDFGAGHTAFIAKCHFERLFGGKREAERASDGIATMPPLMVFDPKDGMREVYPSEARQYREWHGKVAWLYNPFTGDARTPQDIGTDPFGMLIVAPAKDTAPAEGLHV